MNEKREGKETSILVILVDAIDGQMYSPFNTLTVLISLPASF